MSQPKRLSAFLTEHPEGVYCYYSDYAALAADRTKWINLSVEHEKEVAELQGKNAALAVENERLRKAGDAFANKLLDGYRLHPFHDNNLIAAWNAAKEGRDAK